MRCTTIALLVSQALLIPATMAADDSVQLERKIEALNQQVAELTEWLEENDSRLDASERHSALDRVTITGDFRTRGHNLSYNNVSVNPGAYVDFDDFGQRAMAGEFGDPSSTSSAIGQMMAAYPQMAAAFMAGQLNGVGAMPVGTPQTYDINNDMFYTTRLRLNLKAKVWDNVSFSGRLAMFKNWGDDTGVQVFDSWRSFNMDGTSSGNPSGDDLFVERAFFDWNHIGGTDAYLSIGRRPSSYGAPSHFRENEKRGGTPSGHVVNFNFDGLTAGYKLDKITGWEGQVARLCLGQGFESQYGNGELYNNIVTEDTYLGGFNIDVLADGSNFLQVILFGAKDITDGFKGTIAVPDAMLPPEQQMPGMNPVMRVQPSNVIGDMFLGGVTFTKEQDNGLKWFASLGWTRTMPNGNAGMFGGMHSDAVYQIDNIGANGVPTMVIDRASSTEDRDGYSAYLGLQQPLGDGALGLEYNYGSKYWTPFTQAQDDPVGSKLATRGHAVEAYYLHNINPKMFFKMAALYYDYDYSGSGSPVGAPVAIDDIEAGSALANMPVIDTALDLNLGITIKF
ncbi:DUF3373 family protein [uncultured Ferrimonas sp.]|uniref:DUF3373 family protein n=1 Tax=uncultured Ferrimonas sp. TaxID=432640 RepID=UPI0026126B9D|nr:DUF3373 family protein [uncultured Ferrimonas sp.]